MKAKKSLPRGRPPLAPAEKKRRNFTFRGTDQLHEDLGKAAAASGRSLSEEIELRLSRSFFFEEIAVKAAVEAATSAVKATLAYVDAKEEEARSRVRPFSDLLKSSEDEK